jgi:hypothetical protein
MSNRYSNWFSFAADVAILSMAAQQVIALRMLKLAAGGAVAHREAVRMATEKMKAGIEAGAITATGGSSRKVLRRYKTRVKANSRRLSRARRK